MNIWSLVWFVALPIVVIVGALLLLRFADDPADDDEPICYVLVDHRYIPFDLNPARYVIWEQTAPYTQLHEQKFLLQVADSCSPISWN